MAGLFTKNLFVGYSSVSAPKTQQLVDLALVRQDLLNHFNTRRNERVMMPGWGCGVWEYLFEPFDDDTKDAIVLEVQKVIDSDPRVTMKSIDVVAQDQGLRITMVLQYTPFNATATLSIDFDRRSQEMM
jgi:phage baseplate assembly protein W